MQTCAAPRWSTRFADFTAPFVHVAPDAYVEAAKASRFVVDRAEVDDLAGISVPEPHSPPGARRAWCRGRHGLPMINGKLRRRCAAAYAEVSGSDSVFAFLQFTTALTAANHDH